MQQNSIVCQRSLKKVNKVKVSHQTETTTHSRSTKIRKIYIINGV